MKQTIGLILLIIGLVLPFANYIYHKCYLFLDEIWIIFIAISLFLFLS